MASKLDLLERSLSNSNFTDSKKAAAVIAVLRAFTDETGRDASAIDDHALAVRAADALNRAEEIANGR